jgi:predicted O-methyltransferase YrrM
VYTIGGSAGLAAAFRFDTHLSTDERLILYSLIRGLRPQRVLEIGTHYGSSAAIIAAALEDNEHGRIVGLDPLPSIAIPPRHFYGRFDLVAAPSPEGIAEARDRAGGPFDFVHWDCIVIHDQARRDLKGLVPHLADCAYLVMNNPMHVGVHLAIRETIEQNKNWHDCGYICRQVRAVHGNPVAHNGLQLIRIDPGSIANPRPYVEGAFARDGLSVPESEKELLNHDPWYCRTVKPCPWCQEENVNAGGSSRLA